MRAWHRRWLIPLNLLGLIVLVGWWWLSTSPLARLKASGAPTTVEELVAEPVPDKQNVAMGLRDLAPALESIAGEVSTLRDKIETNALERELMGRARAFLDREAATLAAVRAAVRRPVYASLLRAEDLNPAGLLSAKIHNVRDPARLLALACRVELTEGNGEQAAQMALDALKLGKWLEQEPSIVSRLLACGVQTGALNDVAILLSGSPLGEETASRLDESLTAVEDRSALRWALESERVLSLAQFREMPAYAGFFMQPSMLRLFEQAVAAADTPLEGLAAEGKRIGVGASGYASLAAPAIQSLFEADARVGLKARGLRETLKVQ